MKMHGLSAEGATADVKKGTRPTILPYYLIQSFSLFFIFPMFKSFQFQNPPVCSYRASLTSVPRCYTSIFDGLVTREGDNSQGDTSPPSWFHWRAGGHGGKKSQHLLLPWRVAPLPNCLPLVSSLLTAGCPRLSPFADRLVAFFVVLASAAYIGNLAN